MSRNRKALFAIIGFIIGIFVFMPRTEIARYAAMRCFRAAAEKNVFVTAESISGGTILPKAILNGVNADGAAFAMNASRIEISPKWIKTIVSRSGAANLEIGKGEIMTPLGQKLQWSGGSAELFVEDGKIRLENINLNGRFSAQGSLELPRSGGKVSANLTVKVPQELERAFEAAASFNIGGISKVGGGRWRIAR